MAAATTRVGAERRAVGGSTHTATRDAAVVAERYGIHRRRTVAGPGIFHAE
jgi:hypothetical protein